jgi:hypothetical protein
MDEDCGRYEEDGVIGYREASNLANVWAIEAKLMRCGDFRRSFTTPPPESTLRGPLLAEADYPAVLVAKACSDGTDLDLVLYPGRSAGAQRVGIERLRPGAEYRLREGGRERLVRADETGRARLDLALDGRTEVRLQPV